jgi:hypothetical protein
VSVITDLIYQRLRGLVADRIWPNRFAQGDPLPTWPALRYTVVSRDTVVSLCGTTSEADDDVRVQIDIVAKTYTQMDTLKAQVIAALDGTDPPCTRQSGGFETYDVETTTHRAVIDFLFQQSSAP